MDVRRRSFVGLLVLLAALAVIFLLPVDDVVRPDLAPLEDHGPDESDPRR